MFRVYEVGSETCRFLVLAVGGTAKQEMKAFYGRRSCKEVS